MTKERPSFTPLHGPITQDFLDEAQRFNLRFCCEDCALFNHDTEVCTYQYPNQRHRHAYFEQNALGKILIFCREFEI